MRSFAEPLARIEALAREHERLVAVLLDAFRDARFGAQVPLGRIGRTHDVASAVLYLASDDAGFIVGTDLRIDGGAAA